MQYCVRTLSRNAIQPRKPFQLTAGKAMSAIHECLVAHHLGGRTAWWTGGIKDSGISQSGIRAGAQDAVSICLQESTRGLAVAFFGGPDQSAARTNALNS